MDFVGTPVIQRRRRGVVIGPAGHVVEQFDRARDQAQAFGVCVVVEREERERRRGRHEPVDVCVVACDGVGIARVQSVACVVPRQVGARAAEDQVAAVRPPLLASGEAVERRAAADDVVPAEIAEDHVVSAVAFDVVVAIPRGLDRSDDSQLVVAVAMRGDILRQVDRSVALNRVVAELAEEVVVLSAAGEIVVAVQHFIGAVGVVEQRDAEVAPEGRQAVRIQSPRGAHERFARAAIDCRAGQGAEARARQIAVRCPAVERCVIAEDQVLLGAAIDPVVPGSADQHVVAGLAANRVVSADVVRNRHQRIERRDVAVAGPAEQRVVAVRDVGPGASADVVCLRAAQHEILAASGHDRVVAAVCDLDRFHRAQRDRQAGELRRAGRRGSDPAAVADD